MGRERAVIQAKIQSGELNEQEGARAIAALEQRRVPVLREIARQLLVIGSITKNPQLLASAQELNVAIENLGKNLELAAFKKGLQQAVTDTISDAISGGISAAVESGSLSKGFKALAGSFLSGLGGLFITIGKRALVGMAFIQQIVDAIIALTPAAGVAAALALIAFGGVLQGLGGRVTGGGDSGSGGAGSGATRAGAPTSLPTQRVTFDPDARAREQRASSSAPTVATRTDTKASTPQRPVTYNLTFLGTPTPQTERWVRQNINGGNDRGFDGSTR